MEMAAKKRKKHKEKIFRGRTIGAKRHRPGESLKLRNPLILCFLCLFVAIH